MKEIKTNYDLFEKLLKSFPAKINAVIDARDRHTDFWLGETIFHVTIS